jgi:hypothetical protein
MTEQLKTLMHEQAESVTFDDLDLDAMVREGDRRRRSRAVVRGAAGVAAAAVVGVVVVTALGAGGGGDRALDPVGEPPAPAQVSWALGQQLHLGDEVIDVGRDVRAYVRTSDGFLYTDPQGRVYSWSDGEGSEAVGRTSARRPELVSDLDMGQAAWIDTSGDQSTLALLDRDGVREVRDDNRDLSSVYALDAGTAYLLDDRGAFALDLASGRATVLDPEATGDDEILDAEDGLVAFNTPEEGGTEIGTAPGTGVKLKEAYGSSGQFSPDGRWFSIDADEPKIYDARTGERLTFDVGRGFATGYEWLDDSTIAMLAAPEPDNSAQAELITCQVPAATCETAAAQLGTFDELMAQGFALPIGRAIDD